MKLRTKSIIFFGLFLLSIVAVDVFYTQYIVGGTLRRQMSETLQIGAEQSEGSYYAFLKSMKRLVVDWTSDQEIQRITKSLLFATVDTPERSRAVKDFEAYLTGKKMPYDKSVFMVDIIDRNGIVIASTRSSRIGFDEGSEERTNSVEDFATVVPSSFGDSIVSGITFEDKEGASPIIDVMARIFVLNPNGTPSPLDAVLLVHFSNIQEIADVLSGAAQVNAGAVTGDAFLSTNHTSKIYLVNSEKFLVTPTRFTPDVTVQQIVDTVPVRECLENGKETKTEYDDYRGVRVSGASMCLKNEDLVLLVEVDKDEFLLPVTSLLNKTLVVVVLALLFGVITIVFFLRLPLKRLDDIVKALRLVASGNFDVEVKADTNDEIGFLSDMFNKMIRTVREHQASLLASNESLKERDAALRKEIEERKEQGKFLEDSRRATQNLLEDFWEVKEKSEIEKSRLQSIISSIDDAVILIGGDYKVSLVNPKALEIFSLPLTEILDKDLRTIMTICVKKECLESRLWPTEEVFLTNKTVTTTVDDDYSIVTKGRSGYLPVVISAAPLRGAAHGAVLVISDTTADHELSEAKSGFISVASHQLRTPLTSIRWYSEMLLSDDVGTLNEAQKDFMNEIHGGAERLYQTVDLLLGISRVESGKLKAARSPIDIGEFTADIKKEMAPQAYEKKLSVEILPPPGAPVVVWLDPITLRQVVLNLFSNAIRYTNENGIIEVKWTVDNKKGVEEVLYSVRDNGIGIPEAVRSRIFTKFFRAENARSQVPDGSGLGLALVKELVESWGGKVWFDTVLGEGTTFFFSIPLITPVSDNDIQKNAS